MPNDVALFAVLDLPFYQRVGVFEHSRDRGSDRYIHCMQEKEKKSKRTKEKQKVKKKEGERERERESG